MTYVSPVRIFLSYASEDRGLAESLALKLRGAGHSVFFDRDDLPPGEEYDVRIRRAIEGSHLVLFLISPDALAPGAYTLTELGIARRRWPHPGRRVLPVMLRPVPIEAVPPYLREVTFVEPSGSFAADVADHVALLTRRRRRARLIAAVSVLLTLAIAAIALWFWQRGHRQLEVRVTPVQVERWKRGQKWESDRYLVRLSIWNGFDVPVEVNAIQAESRSTLHRIETSYEVSGASYATAPAEQRTPWSAVVRWVRQDASGAVPLHDGELPPGTEWRVCWSAREQGNCSEWTTWSPAGTFEAATATEVPQSIRKRVRAVAWTGTQFLLALTGEMLAVDPSLDFSRAQRRPIDGAPVAIAAQDGTFALATRSPDAVTVVDERTLAPKWTQRVPSGSIESFGETKSLATEPRTLAFDGTTAWIVTNEETGVPAYYRVAANGAARDTTFDESDLRYLDLVYSGALYGLSTTTPHYIYRLTPRITYSGHDIDEVGCIDAFTPAGQADSHYALTCSFRLVRFHFAGPRFIVDERLEGPSGYDPATWEDKAIVAEKGIVTVGMTRYSQDYKPEESHILQRDTRGVWHVLLEIPKVAVESLAGNGDVTLALFRDAQDAYDTYALRRAD